MEVSKLEAINSAKLLRHNRKSIRRYHSGVLSSNACRRADFGSPFHIFIQDNRAKGRKVYTHKSTLAIGEPFIRRNMDDFDYLPARFYQLESMLAAAFGSPLSTQKNPQFLALVGWPYVDDNSNYEWKGADSHSALKDRWPPPSLTGPSELRLPCPIDGCYRNHRDLYGFRSQDALDIHVNAHSLGTIGLHQGAFRSCIDPRCTVEGYPFDLSLHEAQHIDGEWPCGACGLQFRWSHDCEKHVDICSVDDAIDLHKAAREATKLAKMLVCDDHRCGHELEYDQYNVDMMAIHRQMHVDSNHTCPECRLRLKTGAVKMHRDKYCPGRPKPEEEPISTDLVCTDWRCKKRYINGNVQQYNNYVKHLQSHVDGKFTCVDCGVKLSDSRRRAAHKRESCPGKGAQKPVDSTETTSASTEKSLISTKLMPEMTFFHEMPKPIRDLEVAMELLAEVCEPISTITFEMDKHVALL